MGEEEFVVHPAFQQSGKNPGLEIWRIVNFEPVPVEEKTFGEFFNKDAYIILNSAGKKGSSTLSYNLHFWLGKGCSQDESGTAAMRTVELDEGHLDGQAVQHREVQSHESKTFLSYFPKGIRYVEGGADSGFKHYDPNDYTKRLFQVKGKMNVRVEQVECHCGSLNQGDTFVLDDGPNIYVWVGPTSDKKEKSAGVETARRLRDEEKGGKAHIHAVEEDWDTNEEFFAALGSRDKVIRAGDPRDDDDVIRELEVALYKVTENPGGEKWASIAEIATRPLEQTMLDSDKCYVLDSGYSGIFVWTGKSCANDFKRKVWDTVIEFIDSRGYPNWISVTRVVDGGETPLFKQYFETWTDPAYQDKEEYKQNNIAETDYTGAEGIDVNELHSGSTVEKIEDWMPDDGSGDMKIFCIEDSELSPMPEEAYGAFFAGDSYVIQYHYLKDDKDKYIIYFWQGAKTTVNDRTASALQTVVIDNELGGDAVQIRVVMNKEPAHFMKIFDGRIVIINGGHCKGYKSIHDYVDYDPKASYLFQIRGFKEHTRAIQVEARAASLNSNDLFILDSPNKIYAWIGKFCGDQEKEMARGMWEYVAPDKGDAVIIEDEHETPQFWAAIGGEETYYTGQRTTEHGLCIPPRLFNCSNTSGRFSVIEVANFSQDDLEVGDINILDTFDEVFVWIGEEANEFEKKESMKTAYNYLNSDPSGRNPDNTLIICVRQGFEPPQFTGCFMAWDQNLWSEGLTFQEMIDEVGAENAGINLLEDEVEKYTATHPLEVLQQERPPEGVDLTKKEMYLSDEDFEQVFGMTKENYSKVPEWKRINMKKQAGLF